MTQNATGDFVVRPDLTRLHMCDTTFALSQLARLDLVCWLENITHLARAIRLRLGGSFVPRRGAHLPMHNSMAYILSLYNQSNHTLAERVRHQEITQWHARLPSDERLQRSLDAAARCDDRLAGFSKGCHQPEVMLAQPRPRGPHAQRRERRRH